MEVAVKPFMLTYAESNHQSKDQNLTYNTVYAKMFIAQAYIRYK